MGTYIGGRRISILPVGTYLKTAAAMRSVKSALGKVVRGVFWTTNDRGVPVSRSRITSTFGLQPDQVMGGVRKDQLEARQRETIQTTTLQQLPETIERLIASRLAEAIGRLWEMESSGHWLPSQGPLTRQLLTNENYRIPEIQARFAMALDFLTEKQVAGILSLSALSEDMTTRILDRLRDINPERYAAIIGMMNPLE